MRLHRPTATWMGSLMVSIDTSFIDIHVENHSREQYFQGNSVYGIKIGE